MSHELLTQAREGDPDAFAELTGPFRRELQLHCYRILGSSVDAEDMLQETMVAAWRGLGRFEGRSSLRAWLYRIATNKCLNALRDSRGRPEYSMSVPLPEPTRHGEPLWLSPHPDEMLGDFPDPAPGPEARYEARESVSLAFVAALQHLPPRQRATLVLRDVLGFRAAETADILDCSLDAANNALKRARAALADRFGVGGRDRLDRAPAPGSARERRVVDRFVDAFERGDVPGIVGLLTEEAWLTMPPSPFEYQGRATATHFLSAIPFRHGTRSYRLIATRANGQPAFGCYLRDPHAPIAHANGLIVLTLAGDQISAITRFLDNSVLPQFGLPRTIPDD